jgi:hypothetical protein
MHTTQESTQKVITLGGETGTEAKKCERVVVHSRNISLPERLQECSAGLAYTIR